MSFIDQLLRDCPPCMWAAMSITKDCKYMGGGGNHVDLDED